MGKGSLRARNIANSTAVPLSESCAIDVTPGGGLTPAWRDWYAARVPPSTHALADAPQLRHDRLFSSDVVTIERVSCRPNERGCGSPEAASEHQVVVPHRGAFVKHSRGRRVVAHPAVVLFFTAGREYRVSHPIGDGDDCSSLRFAPEVLSEALGSVRRGIRVRDDAPFDEVGAVVAPAPADLLGSRRLRRLAPASASPLEVEETAVALLRRVLAVGSTRTARVPRRADSWERQLRWAVEVALRLATRPGDRWTLAALGREVGCSPYHLARRFRTATGSSIHRTLLSLRLALAAERVLDGANDLSTLALDLGFASHGHLTTAFRAAYGTPPSALRPGAGAPG